MDYIIFFCSAIILQFFLLLLHEVVHILSSVFLKFKMTYIYIYPFYLYKKNNKWSFSINFNFNKKSTNTTLYQPTSLTSSTDYNKLINKLYKYLSVGIIFDILALLGLFMLILIFPKNLTFLISFFLYFSLSTFNFFQSDGKYLIGSKSDSRIAFILASYFTFQDLNFEVSSKSKILLCDIYYNINSQISIKKFDVHDLWNFLNNLNFYTLYLKYSLVDFFPKLDSKGTDFFLNLISDYKEINFYDNRQNEKTARSIILFLIYNKAIDNTILTISKDLENFILNFCNSNYYINLYKYYIKDDLSLKTYLSTPEKSLKDTLLYDNIHTNYFKVLLERL